MSKPARGWASFMIGGANREHTMTTEQKIIKARAGLLAQAMHLRPATLLAPRRKALSAFSGLRQLRSCISSPKWSK
jgi:hypothetical protein